MQLVPNNASTLHAATLLQQSIRRSRLELSTLERRGQYRSWLAGLRSPDFRLALRTACTGIDPVFDRLLQRHSGRPTLRLVA